MLKFILKKEFILIFRDIHALLVLFVMPSIFIVIMSLALKNTYSNNIDVKFDIAIISENNNDIKHLKKELNKSELFNSSIINKSTSNKVLLYENNYKYIIYISKDYKKEIKKNKKDFKISIFTRPDLASKNKLMLKNKLVEIVSKSIMKDYFIKEKINGKVLSTLNKRITSSFIYKNEKYKIKPNSVQQSVPSWLVFSMFFILIPISNAFINEKAFGTIERIRSINVSLFPIIIGKIIPYFIISQLQVLFMIFVGMYIVPLLGGDKLIINGNYFLIFIMTSAISIAAISFALFIASFAKTSEEASSMGGVSNIILAALGGIMVPKFVMPLFMQEISNYSPMSWGLQGLLELFVTAGSFADIKQYIIYLLLFSFVFLFLAYSILTTKRRN